MFFCDFEPELAALVTAGRRREFAGFPEFADPQSRETIPDPSARSTFEQSVLRWAERDEEPHRSMRAFYAALLALRKAEIVPRCGNVNVGDAAFIERPETGIEATWKLDAATLRLEANLAAQACPGFAAAPPGRILFGEQVFPGGSAPAWSVRWSID
jgi:1,4-alpha-glucan branching enzyme